jgi:hypothetical protein
VSDPLRFRKPHRKLRLRSVSAGLRDIVASNSYQRPCFLYDFLDTFAASNDIAAIRPHLWSFSLAPDGWCRAYCALIRAARRRQSLNGLLQAESTQHRFLGVTWFTGKWVIPRSGSVPLICHLPPNQNNASSARPLQNNACTLMDIAT